MLKRILSIILYVVLNSQSGYAQDALLNGKWHGTYSYLGVNYPTIFDLSFADDGSITGEVSTYRNDSAQYISYTVVGTYNTEKNKIDLKGKKILTRKGVWCMPSFDLNVVEVGNQWLIEGRWRPNLKLMGCPPGATGRMSLIKNAPVYVSDDRTEPLDTDADSHTQGMIEGLKERKYHALIIGVNNYADESLKDLDNPINDGQTLIQTLTSYYNFKAENITFLQDPDRSTILDNMQRLSEGLTDRDNLLVFYAGHGIWDEDLQQGYWLPGDATLASRSQWISNATIRDYVRSWKTKHVLLISDACFSGGLLKERGAGKALINVYNMPSRKAMTSGTLTTVPDKSVFMKYLIKYLEENQEPLISADQIYYQTKISVINNSPTNQVPQYGPIYQANDEGGEFVFLRVQ